MFKLFSASVALIVLGSAAIAQQPQITTITGHSDGVGVNNGRWTGQPATAPATASNRYRNFLATDSFNYGSPAANPYFWDINGSNFGVTPGTILITPSPSPFTVTIVSWSPSKIRIKAVATRAFELSTIFVKVTSSTGKVSNSFNDKVVGIIKSRGCYQCTWLVAKTRLDNGLSIPPSAYSITATIPAVGTIESGYRPSRLDCLTFGTNHVAIITSTPSSVPNSDGSLSYSFTVSESNATWNEAISTSTRTLKLSKPNSLGKRTILTGIGTNANSRWVATGYFR